MTQIISDAQSVGELLLDELAPLISGEKSAFARHCHARSISMAHLHAMILLDQNGPLSMGRLAELLGSELPTATGLVTRMAERNLVERFDDTEDRRVVLVRLTAGGLAELQELNAARRQRLGAAIHRLTDAEQLSLLTSIRSLRAALERVSSEGEPIS